MLSLCSNFRVFGDGGDKMVLIATNSNGEQEAFILHNPMINSLTFKHDTISIASFGDECIKYMPGYMTTELALTAGKCEYHQGLNLDKQFDPVWSKSVKELFSVINHKLDERTKK